MYCHVRPSIYVKSEASNRIRRMQFSISFGFRSQYHQRTKRTLIPCPFRAPFSVISSNIGNAIATVHYCISKSVFRTHIQYYEYAKALFHFIHRQWVHDGISERVDLCVSRFSALSQTINILTSIRQAAKYVMLQMVTYPMVLAMIYYLITVNFG